MKSRLNKNMIDELPKLIFFPYLNGLLYYTPEGTIAHLSYKEAIDLIKEFKKSQKVRIKYE